MIGRRAVRLTLALALLVGVAGLARSALASSRSETSLRVLNHQVLAAVNQFRVSHGRPTLRESAALDRSARRHSLEMGRLGYFSHSSAGGTQFWEPIFAGYPRAGSVKSNAGNCTRINERPALTLTPWRRLADCWTPRR